MGSTKADRSPVIQQERRAQGLRAARISESAARQSIQSNQS
ncbi:hypothetical protein [Paenibacillus contaminans]|nr:hypothetical protein [Paenibacillus contaminans]